jgi:hypothetical protein
MSHVLLMFMAMPFLGVRIGMPMLSGGGNTTPPPPPTSHPTYFILGF